VQREKNAAALASMNRLSAQYLRYGDRRIRIFCVGKDCPWVSIELAGCGGKLDLACPASGHGVCGAGKP
jgi:hypothetical protein